MESSAREEDFGPCESRAQGLFRRREDVLGEDLDNTLNSLSWSHSPHFFFLQKWLNNAVFIGTIATTLLNFIPPNDGPGLISAALFTFAALLAIAYSAGIFVYRSYKLRERHAEGLYYDKYGPTVLCGVLFVALAANLGLRWSQM